MAEGKGGAKAHMAVLGVGTMRATCKQPLVDGTLLTDVLDDVTCKRCWRVLKEHWPITTGRIESQRTASIIEALNHRRQP